MELVQNDGFRPQRHEVILREPQQLRVGHELHVGELPLSVPLLVIEDVVVGRQPQEAGVRMILNELKGQKALPCPGRVNHGGAAVALQHGHCRFIGYLVVRIKPHRCRFLPQPT